MQFSVPNLETHSEGVPKEKIYELNKKATKVNTTCSSKTKILEEIDINYEIDFEYPIFDFNGFFTVGEHLLSDTNETNRVIYATESFSNKFAIKNVCYPKETNTEVIIVLGFLDKNGNYYSWNVRHNSKLIKQDKVMKIYLPAKKDNHTLTSAQIIY